MDGVIVLCGIIGWYAGANGSEEQGIREVP